MNRRRRNAVIGAAATGVAATAGVAVGAAIGAREISGPRRPALNYGFTPFEVGIPDDAVEELTFEASDGTRLSGWWLDRPGSERVIICCHGHRGNKSDVLGIGPGLWRAGNTVVAFDFRGNGASDDGPQSLAHYEQRDLRAAIDLVAARRPDAEIDLLGFSMGAATSILVAAGDQRIRKVVADSPFADMHGVISAAATSLRLPPVPIVGLVDRATALLYGYRFAEVEPLSVVAAIAPRPLLIVHCTEDTVIPVEHGYRLAEAAGEGSSLWIVPGLDHCGAYFADRPGYIERMTAFFEGR